MGRDQIGSIIKKNRKALHLTMRELAQQADVDRTYISKIESHGLVPTYPVLLKIEAILGVELQTIYLKKKAPDFSFDTPSRKALLEVTQDTRNQNDLFKDNTRPVERTSVDTFRKAVNDISVSFPNLNPQEQQEVINTIDTTYNRLVLPTRQNQRSKAS